MLRHWTALTALLFLGPALHALAGCDKKDDATPPAVQPSASATPSADPSASASAVASASASAAPSGSTSAAASASVSAAAAPSLSAPSAAASSAPKPSASASAAPSGSAKGPLACGKKPLPDCPLQGWMKANANPAMAASDTPKLGEILEKTAKFAPPGYPNWVSISLDGAKAARSGSLDGAKASCRACHDQYKAKYRLELRDRKI